MRGAPPVEIRVRRQGPWRAFVVALVVLTVASIGLWLASAEVDTAVQAMLAVLTLAAGAAALSTTAPFNLCVRWTGSCWTLARGEEPGSEPVTGVLTVAIDLGGWMLLRFAAGSTRTRTIWIPVQRGSVEGDWHALRCAVHAARALVAPSP
jgi:hypothetical protein